MTIINPNSIAGITSVTAEAGVMNFYKSDGTLAGLQLNGVNFNTTSGISTFNNVYVGGTITYEDVKNVDSVGIITARAGIVAQDDVTFTGNSANALWDKSDDALELDDGAQIRINGTSLRLLNNGTTGLIKGNDLQFMSMTGNDNYITCTRNAGVQLGYNDSWKFETTNTGATVTGTLTATAFSGPLTGNVTGNTSGSSGSCTGNAATASVATNVTVADESSDTSCNLLFTTAATGNLPPKTGTNLTFNSSTGQLTATSYAGDGSNLTGIDATAIQTGNTSVQTATYSITNTVANVGIVTVQPSGLTATGISTFTEINLLDNNYLHIGTGNDLKIYHDSGSGNSFITESGSGNFFIKADDVIFNNAAGSQYHLSLIHI